MKSIYFPALHPSAVKWIRGVPLHWMDASFPDRYYPYLLCSYAYWATYMHKLEKVGPDFHVLGDSGGYAAVTQGEHFDPRRVMEWQALYCRRGLVLDSPPYSVGFTIQFSGAAADHFHTGLHKTTTNVRLALEYAKVRYQSADIMGHAWWGVIQGESVEQMEEWYNAIHEIYPFSRDEEGWALAPKPSTDFIACTRHLAFARDKGIRNVHVLQITRPRTVALVLALAHMAGTFDLVTYDSATQTRAGINRIMLLREGLEVRHIKQSGEEGAVTDYVLAGKCDCPGCHTFVDHHPVEATQFWRYTMLHNQYTLRLLFDDLHDAVEKDPEGLLKWATGADYGKVLREWNGESSRQAGLRSVSILDRLRPF